jgi:4-amino-4-deoxy-L-arabinose transferase-like glycosyltransferase
MINSRFKKFDKQYLFSSALFFLFIFLAISNYAWLQSNKIAPFWDESHHMTTAIKYAESFYSSNIWHAVKIKHNDYPPFFYLISIPFNLILGNSPAALVQTNLIFMAVLIFSVYKIGQTLFNKKIGFLATFLVCVFPMVFGTSRMFLLDFPVTAMVSLSIYFLIKSNYFHNIKYSIFFAVSLWFGLLTKETFFIFLLGPICYVFYRIVCSEFLDKKNRIAKFILSISAGVILSLPYYLNFITQYFANDRGQTMLYWTFYHIACTPFYRITLAVGLIVSITAFFLLKKIKLSLLPVNILAIFVIVVSAYLYDNELAVKITWYTLNLKDQIGWFFLFLVFILFPFFLIRKLHSTFLLFWIIIPYIFFTFCFWFDYPIRWQSRYVIPFLPAFALMLASMTYEIKRKSTRLILLCLMIILGFVQYFFISFEPPIRNIRINSIINEIYLPKDNWWLMHRPVKRNYWRVLEMLKWVRDDGILINKEINVGLLVNTDEINSETLTYYVTANHLPIEIIKNDSSRLFESDYIITLSHPYAWHWEFERHKILKLYKIFQVSHQNYQLVKEFKKLNNYLYVYKKVS